MLYLFLIFTHSDPNWTLAWSDEFDYNGLPDSRYWNYEVGYVRNNEKQYYMKADPRNSRVENGYLIVEAHHDEDHEINNTKYDYSSASLFTKGKVNFLYGKFESYLRVPPGKGTWPALWMVGIVTPVWPQKGEIDIMEYVGKDPKKLHTTLHMPGDHYPPEYSITNSLSQDNTTDTFHNMTLVWSSQRLTMYIDNYESLHYDRPSTATSDNFPFDWPYYLICNLAIGGSWGGDIDESIFDHNVRYYVDYIRYYIDMNDPNQEKSWEILNNSINKR
ncbi:Beta-glucanase [Tritrichomonas foetus]|uniref:Beta-glucanase n=1 Tax=Tritrichomonas foetus TaxID=1144522 RepID=A0A1J4K2W9_9EUKA|nr:Beta-glucanase [Tritrichomonas foetus]|eukprot:OHT04084.1 Beta-glucanase [Tritrichomonas foetus]